MKTYSTLEDIAAMEAVQSAQRGNREVSQDDLETLLTVFDMGLGFALCHRDFGDQRNAIKKLQQDFTEIRAAIAQRAGSGDVAAYVPIHPRNGPLWANTVPSPDNDRPTSYELRPLYFAPSAQPDSERLAEVRKALFWFECLTKCAKLLDLADDTPIPSGVVAAVNKLVSQPDSERDAARYRWLRDKSEPAICAFYLSVGKAFDGVKFTQITVDEAIDAQIAAMAAQQGEKGGKV